MSYCNNIKFFEDLKIEEIAEVLNENINTVKTRLYKSLGKLRRELNDCKEVSNFIWKTEN